MAWHWRGPRFVSFGHQGSGGSKAAPNGSSLFGLAVAKRHRAPRSFVSGLRYGSVSPRSFSDWALRSSPRLSQPHPSHTAAVYLDGGQLEPEATTVLGRHLRDTGTRTTPSRRRSHCSRSSSTPTLGVRNCGATALDHEAPNERGGGLSRGRRQGRGTHRLVPRRPPDSAGDDALQGVPRDS